MSRSESAKDNIRNSVERGIHPGNVPAGYLVRDPFGDAPPLSDPAKAAWVRAAFVLRRDGRTLGDVCGVLAAGGITSGQGKPVSRQALRGILANPFYCGFIRLDGDLYPGLHEPLVSVELFVAVAATFSSRPARKLLN